MRVRNVLIAIGVILILLNLLGYWSAQFDPPQDMKSKIGYLIGWNFLLITGVILLIIAYFRHKKMVAKNKKNMIDNLLN